MSGAPSFFFQAEDGIRDVAVTGVQTCALPILRGPKVYGTLRYESGVHRVQRIPETETQGRRHTSAATVAVLPEAEEVDVKIEEKDLRIDVFRSGGPGGQSVNTTDSAVRDPPPDGTRGEVPG